MKQVDMMTLDISDLVESMMTEDAEEDVDAGVDKPWHGLGWVDALTKFFTILYTCFGEFIGWNMVYLYLLSSTLLIMNNHR